MKPCDQCLIEDTVATWKWLRLRRTTMRSVLFGTWMGVMMEVLSCSRESGEGILGVAYTGIIAGAFWGLSERANLHEAHASNRTTVWLLAGAKGGVVVAAAYLAGRLLLFLHL